jgi:ACS family allantoate permease-like MFS transporter
MADTIEAVETQHPTVLDKEAAIKGQKADEGYDLFEEANTAMFTPEQGKAVRTKIDRHLLPLMCFLYGLNYVDKVAMGWAVLFDFRADLGLYGTQYSWASSMFYL